MAMAYHTYCWPSVTIIMTSTAGMTPGSPLDVEVGHCFTEKNNAMRAAPVAGANLTVGTVDG